MITVIGIFEDAGLAEEAASYLLANEFTSENIDLHTSGNVENEPDKISDFFAHLIDDEQQAAHYATLGKNGSIVTVHAISAREGQEAADAMNNYGAIEVNASDDTAIGSRSQVIERIVDEGKRLRSGK